MKFYIDFKQSKHQLITNSKQLKEAIKKCQEAGLFSFDCETAPKEEYRDNTIYPEAVFNPQQADIVTLSFAYDESFSYVVPIKHRKGVNYESEFDLWHQLKYEIFANEKVLKLVFNAPFEFKFLTKYEVFCDKNLVDVHLLAVRISQVLRPNEVNPAMPNKGYGLKDLSLKYLNYEQTHFEDVLVANGAKFFDDLDIADGLEYSADDANLPIALWKIFKAEAEGVEIPALCNGVDLGERPYKNYYEWIANVESPATRCIGMMQCYGVGFNTSAAEVMGVRVEREQEHARKELIKVGKRYGVDLKPGKTGKSKSVKDFLYGTLGCPVLELTPAAGISMSAESIRDTLMLINMDIFDPNTLKNLEDITRSVQELEAKMKSIEDFAKEFGKTENMDKAYEQYSNNLIKINERYFKEHDNKEDILETLKYINEIQHNGTLLSSHVNGRAKYVNPADNRVKPNYNAWTDTSRLASNKPNGQNMPRADKDKFGIRSLHRPQYGHVFIAIDYQAQEVRIAADMYQEDHMIELINQGVDIHSATANGVFNLGLNVFEGDRAPKTERNAAKIALFGTFYGGSAYSLIKLYRNAGMYKSLKYCKDVINGLLKTYPGMDAFQNDVVDHASDVGYVETFLGYRRMLPLLSDDEELEIAVEKKWYKSHAQFMNRLKVSIDKILDKRDTTNDRKFDGEIKGASDIPTIDLHLIKDYLSIKKAAKYTNGQGFLEYYHDVENGSQMENILVYTINYIKKSEKRQLRSGTARKALNTPIQGSAADITKVGMNNVMNMFATGELDTDIVKFVASIHDENVFEINASAIDPKELDRIVHVLVDAMSGKVLKGLKVEQIAEPEIIDPYNVYGLEGEDVELCQGWSNKKDYYKWIEAVNNM